MLFSYLLFQNGDCVSLGNTIHSFKTHPEICLSLVVVSLNTHVPIILFAAYFGTSSVEARMEPEEYHTTLLSISGEKTELMRQTLSFVPCFLL